MENNIMYRIPNWKRANVPLLLPIVLCVGRNRRLDLGGYGRTFK